MSSKLPNKKMREYMAEWVIAESAKHGASWALVKDTPRVSKSQKLPADILIAVSMCGEELKTLLTNAPQ